MAKIAKLGDTIAQAMTAFTGRIEIVLLPPIDEQDPTRPRVIIALRVKDEAKQNAKSALTEMLTSIIKVFEDNEENTFETSEVEIAGLPAARLANTKTPDDPAYIFAHGDFAFITDSDTVAARVIANIDMPPQPSLFHDPVFINCMNKTNGREIKIFGNLRKIVEIAGQHGLPFPAQFASVLESAGYGLSFVNDGIIDELQVFSTATQMLAPLADLAKKSLLMKSLKLFPVDAPFYGSINLPSAESLMPMVTDMLWGNQIFVTADEALRAKTGFSLLNDIIPDIGSEVSFSMNIKGIMPDILATIEMKDTENITNLLDLTSWTDLSKLLANEKPFLASPSIKLVLPDDVPSPRQRGQYGRSSGCGSSQVMEGWNERP